MDPDETVTFILYRCSECKLQLVPMPPPSSLSGALGYRHPFPMLDDGHLPNAVREEYQLTIAEVRAAVGIPPSPS